MADRRYKREYVQISKETNRAMYRIVDTETGKVVKQGNEHTTQTYERLFNEADDQGANPTVLYGGCE